MDNRSRRTSGKNDDGDYGDSDDDIEKKEQVEKGYKNKKAKVKRDEGKGEKEAKEIMMKKITKQRETRLW